MEVTLAEARQEFLDYLAERNKSLRTVRTYGFAINKFLHFALEHRIPFVYASTAAVYGASTNFTEAPEKK